MEHLPLFNCAHSAILSASITCEKRMLTALISKLYSHFQAVINTLQKLSPNQKEGGEDYRCYLEGCLQKHLRCNVSELHISKHKSEAFAKG